MFRSLTACAVIGLAGLIGLPSAHADTLPVVRICAGPAGLNYEFAVKQIQIQAHGTLDIEGIHTEGSLQNLELLAAEKCDAAIVQSDAFNVYKKQNASSALDLEGGRPLYDEFVHFICTKESGITRITQLTNKQTVLIGPNGGGSSVTWESFKIADPDRYGPPKGPQTLPYGGERAVNMLLASEAQCMIQVTGLKAQGIMKVNAIALQQKENTLLLEPADDSDMPDVKDIKGKPMYVQEYIPSGTYPGGLQPKSIWGSRVRTIAVHAMFVASTKWADSHEKDYAKVLDMVNRALPAILIHVAPLS